MPASDDLHFASQTEAELYLINKKLSIAHQEAHRITATHRRQIAKLEQIRAALDAPVYKLPDELLAHIFQLYASPYGHLRYELSLVVSWVVSRWRRVALGTSALWTTFELYVPGKAENHSMLRAFSERIAGRPLALKVIVSRGHTFKCELENPSMDLLKVLKQCRTLTVCPPLYPLSSGPCYNVTLPRLPFRTALPISYLNLAQAIFRCLTDFLDLLRMCSSVQRLVLNDVWIQLLGHADRAHESDTIELPALTHLSLDGVRIDVRAPSLSFMLSCMRTPKLDSLKLSSFGDIDGPLTSPNFSNITALAVDSKWAVCAEILAPTICGMPSLRRLLVDLPICNAHDLPLNLRVPRLERVDLASSDNAGRFALWLVEGTTSEDGSSGSMKLMIANSRDGLQALHISREDLGFIRTRVPRVQLRKVKFEKRQTARKR